jgi:hypothetical protein
MGLDIGIQLGCGEMAKPGAGFPKGRNWSSRVATNDRAKEQFVKADHQNGCGAIVDLPHTDNRASCAGLEESRGQPGELVRIARLDGLQLPGITGQDHLRAAFLSQADQVGQVGVGIIEDSSTSSRTPSAISSGLRPPRWPGR